MLMKKPLISAVKNVQERAEKASGGSHGIGMTARFQDARRKGRRLAARYTPNSTEFCLPISERSGTLLFIIGDLMTI